MHLRRARFAQKADNARAGRAADDGIIHHDDALALDGGGNGVQLDTHRVLPLLLPRLNKRAPDVLVFDEADAVGNPAGAAVPDGGIQTGIRHADDHIRLNRMVKREEAARPDARLVDAAAVNDGIGTREINELEDAHAVMARAGHLIGMNPLFVDDDDFARLNIAHERRADGIQRAALRRKHHIVADSAHAQRTEAMRVAAGNQLRRTHDDERIRALDDLHGVQNRLFNRTALQALLRDDVGNHLGIRRAVENRAVFLQLFAKLRRIGQISVVCQCHRAFLMVNQQRLGIGTAVHPRCTVAAVTDRHRSLVDFAQRVAREHLRHQSVVLVRLHHAIIVDDNAAALLTAVLQGIQRMIRLRDDALVGGIRAVNAEHAALLVQLVKRRFVRLRKIAG